MKELLDDLAHVPLDAAHGLTLIDTCALIDAVLSGHEKLIAQIPDAATTSFNAEELVHVEHRIHHKKHQLRNLLKAKPLRIIDVPVSPGDREGERSFVASIDPALLAAVPDASDAVLAAAALKTSSDVITKDKHHLFTGALVNLFSQHGIAVHKELKDAL